MKEVEGFQYILQMERKSKKMRTIKTNLVVKCHLSGNDTQQLFILGKENG